ncbi:PaaI family thioesterase [Citricoccus nitrophenolicus]|uniref:Thioesterase superfamily protein n=1 Tax=Citricoccus muralis TaxID=169134 RepID=A0A3D9LGI6_9MICC|nr:PaaI family thioesterase [Citricoccus muralis]REE04950.1 thioesterase superfamily protein [Citricoccus muralis]
MTFSTSQIPAPPSAARPQVLGRTEQLTRVQLFAAQQHGARERTGTLRTGPWSLDPEGRPTGLSAAVLLDNTLARAIRAAAMDLDWIVTTELQLNFNGPYPAEGAVLESWASAAAVDSLGGMAQATLQDAEGTVYVHATGWFQSVGPSSSATADQYSRLASLPLGPETEVSLASLVGMQGNTVPTEGERPSVTDHFQNGPQFAENDELMNPQGAVHGGALTIMSGLAAQQPMPDRTGFDLQSLRVLFLRPAGGPIATRTRVRHAGRSLRIVDVELVAGGAGVGHLAQAKPFVQAEAVFRAAR